MGTSAEVVDRPLPEAAAERQPLLPLDGRVALVTGAGRGLGEAIVEALASAGATVVVADVREDAARDVAWRLACSGASASALALDVSDEEQARAAVESVEREHGKLDVLVNNAGILRLGFIESQPLDEYLAVVNVNQVGCFLGMQAVIPALKANGGGSIVNTSSTSGFIGVAGLAA